LVFDRASGTMNLVDRPRGTRSPRSRRGWRTQLIDATPFANYGAANLQYGIVRKLLWEELPVKFPIGSDGNPIYTFALAEPGDRTAPEDQWVWHMRAAVADAIKYLGLDT
jgi:hypothetical protein